MLKEAYIPENTKTGFLFKMWNTTVKPFSKPMLDHRHLQFEIVLFKSGNGVYSTKSGTYDIKKNDVFVFSSNEQHCITEAKEGEDFTFLNLHFEPRYVWGSKSDGFSSDSMNICFSHNDNFCCRLPRDNEYTEKIIKLILEAERELTDKHTEYQLMVHNKVYEIMVILARHLGYGTGKTVTAEERSHIKAVKTAIDYISKHLTEQLSLQSIAERVDLSPNYFSHVFKKTVGISLWDYITSKRIEVATALINDNIQHMNIIDIASACGFNNTANFNKAFRRVTGMTPTEFNRHGEYIG